MGLLTVGQPLSWSHSLPYLSYIKKHGVIQFLNVWNKHKNRCGDQFKWGDEIEYILVYAPTDNNIIDNTHQGKNPNKECKLSLRSSEIQIATQKKLDQLSKHLNIPNNQKFMVQPEYGSFMLETIPFTPYGGNISDLFNVETNMLYRRDVIESCLNKNEKLCSISSFPTLGCGNYSFPYFKPNGPIAKSRLISVRQCKTASKNIFKNWRASKDGLGCQTASK